MKKDFFNVIDFISLYFIVSFIKVLVYAPPMDAVRAYGMYADQINLYSLSLTVSVIGSILLDNIRKSKEVSNEI